MRDLDDFPHHKPMTFGTSEYRLDRANAHLTNFEEQLRVAPDDTDPRALDALATRLQQIARDLRRSADYSRHCRQIAAEADARVKAMFLETEHV